MFLPILFQNNLIICRASNKLFSLHLSLIQIYLNWVIFSAVSILLSFAIIKAFAVLMVEPKLPTNEYTCNLFSIQFLFCKGGAPTGNCTYVTEPCHE